MPGRPPAIGGGTAAILYLKRHAPSKLQAAAIGVRKAPAPDGRPGFIHIDSVHQGDFDGIKGLYHINAVGFVGHPTRAVGELAGGNRVNLLERYDYPSNRFVTGAAS